MNPDFKELVNQLVKLEDTTDSSQGVLCMVTDAVKEKRKYMLNDYTIRKAVKCCRKVKI